MPTVTVTRTREWWGFHRRILIEVDGKRVGGIWNGRQLRIDLPAGQHTFQAFTAWIGSKPLIVEIQQDRAMTLGVRAPWDEAAAANVFYAPMGPAAYPMGMPDTGLEIWEKPASSNQTTAEHTSLAAPGSTRNTLADRRRVFLIAGVLAAEVASVAVGPLIAHAAGASSDIVVFSGIAGVVGMWFVLVPVLIICSSIGLARDSRRSQN